MATSEAAASLDVSDKIRRMNPYKDWREFASCRDIDTRMLEETLSTDLVFRVREGKRDVKRFKAHSYLLYTRSPAFGRLLERLMVMRHHGETDVIEADEKNIGKVAESAKSTVRNGERDAKVYRTLAAEDDDGPNIRGVAFDVKLGIIDIYDVRPDVFEEILRYIYYDKININRKNIYEMTYAAHKFQMYDITEKCNEFLRGFAHITQKNVLQCLEKSLIYNALGLMNMCVAFIGENMDLLEQAELEDQS